MSIFNNKTVYRLKQKNSFLKNNHENVVGILNKYHNWMTTVANGRSKMGMTLHSANSYTRTLLNTLIKQDKVNVLISITDMNTFTTTLKEPSINSAQNKRCHSRLHHSFKNFNKFIVFYNSVQCSIRSEYNIFCRSYEKRYTLNFNKHVAMIKN